MAIPIGQVIAGPAALALGDRSTLAIGAVLIFLATATATALAVPSVRELTLSDHR